MAQCLLEKTFGADVIYFHPKLVRDLDVLAQWDSAQNEQWMWMTKICKNEKKSPRAELKISGAEKQFWQEKQKLGTCEKP